MTYTQIPSESSLDKRDRVYKSLAEIARHLYSIQGDLPGVVDSGLYVITQTDIEYLTTLLQVTHRAHEKVCEMLKRMS